MIDWLKKLAREAQTAPTIGNADDAVAIWCQMTGANAIEDVWDALDAHFEAVRHEVRRMLVEDRVGEVAKRAGVLWLSYQTGNRGEALDTFLEERLEESIVWALKYQTNHVLTGGALGALDGLTPEAREAMALRVFRHFDHQNTRRYWLLMKVRTDTFVGEIARALRDYDPADRRRVVGGFRQFVEEDIPVLEAHYDPSSPGADLFIEAFGATRSPRAADYVVSALGHDEPRVREAARKALTLLGIDEDDV